MKLIQGPEQTPGCGECRYYLFRSEELFPHGCRAMKYVGKKPASRTVLDLSNGLCPLFEPVTKPQP